MKHFPCSDHLKLTIETHLNDLDRMTLDFASFRRVAVAVTLVDYRDKGNLRGLGFTEDESAAVLLTRRSGGLKNHAGQWAFPGGSIDSGESPEQTALRELEEEVGLSLSSERVLGCLDDYRTRSGFHICPVVVWGGVVQDLYKNEQEVASIHRIPCSELFRDDAPILESSQGGGKQVLYMPVGDTWIAAPTAAILYQFREVALAGRKTQVFEYDQPYFAWS